MSRRLKLLVSAFCCDAYDVSEDLDGFNWVRHLAPHCDITLFTLARPGRKCGTEEMPGVRTFGYPQTWLGERYPSLEKTILPSYFPFSAYAFGHAVAAMRKERFDLVHQITPAALRFPSSMALLNIPFVLGPAGGGVEIPESFRGDVPEPAHFRLRQLDRIRLRLDPSLIVTLARASRILVQGEYALEMLPEWARRKTVVMLGAGIDQLPPLPQRAGRRNEIRILFVGRLVPVKGLKYVLAACERLAPSIKWRLTVVGDGPEMEAARAAAARLAARGTVEFAGWLPRAEVLKRYGEADAFCFPSLKEAGGNVVLEAMSYGLPVIVVDNGGPSTTVTDRCGFKVRPESIETVVSGIARALSTLAASPEMRARMGQAARERVAGEYLWDVKVLRMLDLYREVIAERGARRARGPVEGALAREASSG